MTAALAHLRTPPARVRWARFACALAVVLPVPLSAAAGLSLPLPASVARLAARLVPFESSSDRRQGQVLAHGSIIDAVGNRKPQAVAPTLVPRLGGGAKLPSSRKGRDRGVARPGAADSSLPPNTTASPTAKAETPASTSAPASGHTDPASATSPSGTQTTSEPAATPQPPTASPDPPPSPTQAVDNTTKPVVNTVDNTVTTATDTAKGAVDTGKGTVGGVLPPP